MRPNEVAAFFLILAVGLLFLGLIGLPYWDSLLRPFIELTGAFIHTFSLPGIAVVLVVMVGTMVYRIYRP
ncbi:MAG: hypothetical protein AAB229_05630 [Candidatus Hydrogenedentota bacterium]